MRSPVNRLARLACVLSLLLAAGPSLADPRDAQWHEEQGRFALGVAITGGVLIAQQNGRADTTAIISSLQPCFLFDLYGTCTPGPAINGRNPANPPSPVVSPTPFANNAASNANSVSPNMGVTLELMTPALDIVPGKPRVFAAFEILPTYASELTVALSGAATELRAPENLEPQFFSVNAIEGSGSRVTAEVMTTVLAANLGPAFAFEYRDRVLRLKPSVAWLRWGVITEGKSLDAFKNDPVVFQNQEPLYGSFIRNVDVRGRSSGFFNAVGPGLELEIELGRRGDFRPVMYASGFAYRTVGEDTIVYQGSSGTINDTLGQATYLATYTFQVDDWSYRAAIGFRLRWVGL